MLYWYTVKRHGVWIFFISAHCPFEEWLNPLLRFTAQGKFEMHSFQPSFQFLSEIYLVWSCYTELRSDLTPQWLFMILWTTREHISNISNNTNESREKQKVLYSGFSLQFHECFLYSLLPLLMVWLWECQVNWKATAFQPSNSFSLSSSTFPKGYQPQFGHGKLSSSNISTWSGAR